MMGLIKALACLAAVPVVISIAVAFANRTENWRVSKMRWDRQGYSENPVVVGVAWAAYITLAMTAVGASLLSIFAAISFLIKG